jgi:hypothetical protein
VADSGQKQVFRRKAGISEGRAAPPSLPGERTA